MYWKVAMLSLSQNRKKMCTVTYIPRAEGGFILTSNRDESPARTTRKLDRNQRNGQQLVFPRDAGAGGTWIALSNADRVVCLLNGAFTQHKHQPPYKKSRGIMVLEFFDHANVSAFAKNYDFQGMEPFTMIVLESQDLRVLRWNEAQLHDEQLKPTGHYIWSSATLYSTDVQTQREQWFNNWLDGRTDFSRQAILDLHRQGGADDNWNGFIMNRNNLVRTVSITSIQRKHNQLDMRYESLMHDERTTAGLTLTAKMQHELKDRLSESKRLQ